MAVYLLYPNTKLKVYKRKQMDHGIPQLDCLQSKSRCQDHPTCQPHTPYKEHHLLWANPGTVPAFVDHSQQPEHLLIKSQTHSHGNCGQERSMVLWESRMADEITQRSEIRVEQGEERRQKLHAESFLIRASFWKDIGLQNLSNTFC